MNRLAYRRLHRWVKNAEDIDGTISRAARRKRSLVDRDRSWVMTRITDSLYEIVRHDGPWKETPVANLRRGTFTRRIPGATSEPFATTIVAWDAYTDATDKPTATYDTPEEAFDHLLRNED